MKEYVGIYIYQNQKKHRNKMALATKLNTTSTLDTLAHNNPT